MKPRQASSIFGARQAEHFPPASTACGQGNSAVESPVTVGLLTPYGGGNLGDRAIQETVIYNLKKRISSCGLYLVTLYPERTTRIHDAPSFPLAVTPGPFWLGRFVPPRMVQVSSAEPIQQPVAESPATSARSGALAAIAEAVNSFLKGTRRILARAKILKNIYHWAFVAVFEVRHWGAVFRQLKRTDLLIVSGGGQIDEEWGGAFGHPYALFKWSVIAKITGTPFVVLSVGASPIQTRVAHFFVSTALRNADFCSFRDSQSQNLVESLGIKVRSAVTADLAFGLPLTDYVEKSREADGHRIIGIGTIAYGHLERWPTPDVKVYDRYVTAMAEFVGEILRQGFSVVFFSSATTEDFVSRSIVEHLPAELREKCRDRIMIPKIETMKELLEQMIRTEYIVASRFHSVLLSLVLNKPVIALSFDRKVDWLMLNAGLSAYTLDIRGFDPKDLSALFWRANEEKERIEACTRAFNDACRASVERQFEELVEAVKCKRAR